MFLLVFLLPLVSSDCILKAIHNCLTYEVNSVEHCQVSHNKCLDAPQECQLIDSSYSLNC